MSSDTPSNAPSASHHNHIFYSYPSPILHIARHRLAAFEKDKNRCPITVVKFNPMGNSFFYGLSYDWSKGAEHNNPALGNQIMYHPVVEADITPKKTN